MTISKKLFFIATIGLSLGTFNVSAYDVISLKEEVQLISAFAKNHYDYIVEYGNQQKNLGCWLENKIYHTYTTSNSTIIELANIIKQNDIDQLMSMIDNELRSKSFKKDFVMIFCLLIGSHIIFNKFMKYIDSKIFPKTFTKIEYAFPNARSKSPLFE